MSRGQCNRGVSVDAYRFRVAVVGGAAPIERHFPQVSLSKFGRASVLRAAVRGWFQLLLRIGRVG
jgi:hypothetical protein